jgi:hypothetical protein
MSGATDRDRPPGQQPRVLALPASRDDDGGMSEMSFSQLFGTRRGDEVEQQQNEWVAPAWFGPPVDELPVCVPLTLVLARSETGVIALSHASVYSTGVAIELLVQARGLPEREAQRLFHEQHMPPTESDPSPAYLRLGIEFADGSRASNLQGRHQRHDPEQPPAGPVLIQHGAGSGSSGPGRVSMRPGFWLWPLPPPGPVRLVCEWPLLDIPLTTVELDADELRSAASRALKLWEP